MAITEKRPGPGGRPVPPVSRLADKPLTIVSPSVSIWRRIVAIWRYRELLMAMIRKELKVQFKDSVLGFLWSMLNPLSAMVVYYFVFQIVLKAGIPRFAIYLMSGAIVFNFFSSAVSGACASIVANGNIVKKVAFPREIPVLAQLGSAAVQTSFQFLVLLLFMVIFQHGPAVAYLPLVVPAVIGLFLFSAALGLYFAAVNVRLRDMQHLLAVMLQIWFWATPIVYQFDRITLAVAKSHREIYHILYYVYRLNPITPVVLTFQRAFYGDPTPNGVQVLPPEAGIWWYLNQDLILIVVSSFLLYGALRVFRRREGSFAEEL